MCRLKCLVSIGCVLCRELCTACVEWTVSVHFVLQAASSAGSVLELDVQYIICMRSIMYHKMLVWTQNTHTPLPAVSTSCTVFVEYGF